MVLRIAFVNSSEPGAALFVLNVVAGFSPRSMTSRYASNVNSAVLAQENSAARRSPFRDNSSLNPLSWTTLAMASVNSRTLDGSTSSAAPPATSFSDELFEVMTGAPQAIASTIGNPKPSRSDGYTNAVAPLKSSGSSARGTYPRNFTAPLAPSALAFFSIAAPRYQRFPTITSS